MHVWKMVSKRANGYAASVSKTRAAIQSCRHQSLIAQLIYRVWYEVGYQNTSLKNFSMLSCQNWFLHVCWAKLTFLHTEQYDNCCKSYTSGLCSLITYECVHRGRTSTACTSCALNTCNNDVANEIPPFELSSRPNEDGQCYVKRARGRRQILL